MISDKSARAFLTLQSHEVSPHPVYLFWAQSGLDLFASGVVSNLQVPLSVRSHTVRVLASPQWT